MICPECGGDTYVVESTRADHTVIRRRKCSLCGERYYTKEIRIDKSEGNRDMEEIKRQRYPDRLKKAKQRADR